MKALWNDMRVISCCNVFYKSVNYPFNCCISFGGYVVYIFSSFSVIKNLVNISVPFMYMH